MNPATKLQLAFISAALVGAAIIICVMVPKNQDEELIWQTCNSLALKGLGTSGCHAQIQEEITRFRSWGLK